MKRLTLEEFLKQPAGTMYMDYSMGSPSIGIKGRTIAVAGLVAKLEEVGPSTAG